MTDKVRRRGSVMVGGILATLAVLAWLALIHNRFFTPYEGWFSYYGLLMKNGAMPYRDFYFFTQPVDLLISRTLVEFGDKLIYFRYYGLIERTLLTALLYYLLSRQFSAAASFIGTVAASFFYIAYATDALFSYLNTCLLFFVLALVCLEQSRRNAGRRRLWLVLCGISLAWAFFTKQSSGLLAIASVTLTVAVLSESLRDSISELLPLSAGIAAGSIPFLWWLTACGLWQPYVTDVFRGAVQSKGGPSMLVGFLTRQILPLPLVCFGILVIFIVFFAVQGKLTLTPRGSRAPAFPAPMIFAVMIGAVAAALVSVRRVGTVELFLMRYGSAIVAEVLLYAVFALFALAAVRRVFRGPGVLKGQEMPFALLAASFFWTWGCGMSWSVEEQSVIPSLALLLTWAYDRVRFGQYRRMSGAVLAAAVAIVFLSVWQKWSCAFNWEGWRQAVSSGGAHSNAEQISDFSLDPEDAAMYDSIFRDLKDNLGAGDRLVTFPSIPLFNIVTGNPQPTFAPVHTLDVCPDEVSRQDSRRVTVLRPKMIVNLRLADWVWKEHDGGLRGGRRSGEHEFQESIDRLTSSGHYRLVRTWISPFYKMPMNVWLRDK